MRQERVSPTQMGFSRSERAHSMPLSEANGCTAKERKTVSAFSYVLFFPEAISSWPFQTRGLCMGVVYSRSSGHQILFGSDFSQATDSLQPLETCFSFQAVSPSGGKKKKKDSKTLCLPQSSFELSF